MTENTALLKKVIHIQSCIIEGHSLKALLHQETPYFKKESGADSIVICMENEKHVDIEIVLEEKKKFLSLLRKYNLLSKKMRLKEFIEQCSSRFSGSEEYIKIQSLYDIFHGALSRKNSEAFEKEMGFHVGHLFPVRNEKGRKIGFIMYFFSKESPVNSQVISEVTEVLETLVRPFYDEKLRIMHAKCVKIDEKMQRLTEKEKQVAQRVLLGQQHKKIAEEMNISINTLKTHMKNIFNKYEVSSKIELHNKLTGGQ